MSLSGSPIVNHGPDSNAQVFIPLGNGRVRVLLRFSFEEKGRIFPAARECESKSHSLSFDVVHTEFTK